MTNDVPDREAEIRAWVGMPWTDGRATTADRHIRTLLDALDREREAGEDLLREYEREAAEHGFPFNFALRAAHARFRALLHPEDASEGKEG